MKIQFSSGLQTSANMHSHTHIHTHTHIRNITICNALCGWPNKKKSIVAAHIVRQADRQSTAERERDGETGTEWEGDGTFVAQTFVDLCNKTVAHNYNEFESSTISQLAANPQRGHPLRKCLHLYSCIIKTEYAVQCFLSLASLATPPTPLHTTFALPRGLNNFILLSVYAHAANAVR